MRETASCVRRESVRKPRSSGCVYRSVMFAPKLGLKVEKMLVDSHRMLSQATSYRPPPHFNGGDPETSSPPLTFDAHRLADTLAQALPPLSNRTLSSLLGRLKATTPSTPPRGPPCGSSTAAPTTRREPPPSAVITTARSGPRPPNSRPAESRSPKPSSAGTFARVVLAALPSLVERIRTLCRQALGRDRDDSRNQRVILGQAPPGPTPPERA